MGYKAIVGWAIVSVSLVLTALASPGEAALGCFREGGFSAATCDTVADCAPVGGVDCTVNFCVCDDGPVLCPCAAQPAPLLSQRGMLGSAALVCAIGLLGLLRRAGLARRDPA